ncbi:ABC transporter substrate-binding protein [Caldinitratiruptor microaerophilus]|uniref:Branched-chain amino acid ABC transporter substrate-binding protein n=1 Tax=Caldinitratiruptor microaerophilus TaxID=671077 RepID=A0AA35CK27_9FIRM|nr:penicillin-binding protein activator [Caldinitratiruptor microaerophilus]BDG59833.1 branched-chain amino acid ABC transporter substrate-binding protein [Caldinitratiruptor microaerophilus]
MHGLSKGRGFWGGRSSRRVLLAAALSVALLAAGCGGGGGAGTAGSGQKAPAGGGSASAEVTYPSEVTIGALVPLTGTGASYGVLDSNGANLAVEQLNAKGGVKGIKIKIEYEDHQAKPQVAITGFNRLVDVHKVPYVLSSYSSVTLAVAPLADEKKVVVMNGGGQSDNLAGAAKYLFNDIPLVGFEARSLAQYLVKERGVKTAAIIFANDDGGRSSLKAFKEAFTQAGGTIVAEEASELGGSDFRPQLAKIKSKNADVMFIATYGRDTAVIIKQAREVGVPGVYANTSWSVIPDVFKLPEAEGLLFTALHFTPEAGFAEAYKAKYGEDPALYSLTFYDGVMIFAKALEWVVDHKLPLNGESIYKAIKEIRTFPGGAGPVTFADDGTSTKDVAIRVLKNGKGEDVKILKAGQ